MGVGHQYLSIFIRSINWEMMESWVWDTILGHLHSPKEKSIDWIVEEKVTLLLIRL
jgi:hypothetical protein